MILVRCLVTNCPVTAGVGSLDYTRCGCRVGEQDWLRPLELHRTTGVATRLALQPHTFSRNRLVGLGPHSVPLFLIKGFHNSH